MSIKEISQFAGIGHSSEILGKNIPKKESPREDSTVKPVGEDGDRAQISEKAKAFLRGPDLTAEKKSIVRELQEGRLKKVREAREKVSSGFYEKPEVIDKIALALSKSPAFRDIIINYARANELVIEANELPDLNPEKVSQSRQRAEDGFYTRPEVIEDVARKLRKLM